MLLFLSIACIVARINAFPEKTQCSFLREANKIEKSIMKLSQKVPLIALMRKVSPNYSLLLVARLLSSIIYALISTRASVISCGYQSTQLINCRHTRTWGFMVQKCNTVIARGYFCA